MSAIETESLKYNNPQIAPRPSTIYPFNQLKTLQQNSQITSSIPMRQSIQSTDYPCSGKHSRVPVTIQCENCRELTMTEIEYERGKASYLWCLVLMPFLGTGCCCVCIDACKDVRHCCGRCRREAGVCRSRCL